MQIKLPNMKRTITVKYNPSLVPKNYNIHIWVHNGLIHRYVHNKPTTKNSCKIEFKDIYPYITDIKIDILVTKYTSVPDKTAYYRYTFSNFDKITKLDCNGENNAITGIKTIIVKHEVKEIYNKNKINQLRFMTVVGSANICHLYSTIKKLNSKYTNYKVKIKYIVSNTIFWICKSKNIKMGDLITF